MTDEKQFLQALLRQDFSSFISKVFHTINPGCEYQANWHIDLIADYLEAVRSGKIKRLIINMPPRALKSVCVSVAWPAWLLGKDPAKRIMVASYSSVLSIKHSLDCRLVIESGWYKTIFINTKLSKKHNQKNKFLTSKNGFRFATSIGGSATGEGGDVLIIDDPHNPTQINSLKNRRKAIDWFEQTFVTRLNDKSKGAIVLVMQRLHEDDLSAHLIASGNWNLLKIPVIATQTQIYPIGDKNYCYEAGQLLNNTRDKIEFLNNIEQEIGHRNFAAQFLQEPLSCNISLLALEDIHYYHDLPLKFDYYVLSWDTAIKVSDSSDYSAGTCWGIYEGKYYLIDIIRKKLNYPDLKRHIEQQMAKYKPKYTLIEDKASGQSLIQDLVIAGHVGIKNIKPTQDKVTRFAAAIPVFQSGQILFPIFAAFNREVIRELTNFPSSAHDDIVDSVSQFVNFTKSLNKKIQARVRMI